MKTKEYLKLIKEKGWVLKSFKDKNLRIHYYYVAAPGQFGHCEYVNKIMFDNLVKEGIVPVIIERTKNEKSS